MSVEQAGSDKAKIWGCVIVGVIGLGLFMALGKALIWIGDNFPTTPSKASDVGPASIATLASCDEGEKVTGVDFAVRSSSPLLDTPDETGTPVTVTFGPANISVPVAVDQSVSVREVCRKDEWSKVRVLLLPDPIGSTTGWVPSNTLKAVRTNAQGRRLYQAADLQWPAGSAPHRRTFLAVANRIMEQNPKCDAINDQSLSVERDTGGTLLKIACYGAEEQAFDFRPADASNGRSFAPVAPIAAVDKQQARNACQSAALRLASHPSTVDFHYTGETFDTFGNGGARFTTTLTARNSFNLELTHRATCEFRGNTLQDVQLSETR
jgi:hypothetical protein